MCSAPHPRVLSFFFQHSFLSVYALETVIFSFFVVVYIGELSHVFLFRLLSEALKYVAHEHV